MPFLSDVAAGILRLEEIGPLIVEPIKQASVALQVTSNIDTDSPFFRFPRVDVDAAASWVPEGATIPENPPTVDELKVIPSKVAALVKISNELAEDSSPEAANLVQDSIARSVARAVDRAFFANTTTNGPNGLLSVIGIQAIDLGSFTNFDWAVQTKALMRKVGSEPTAFVASADTVATLSSIKTFTGTTASSNMPVLSVADSDHDVTQPAPESVLGVPLVAVQDSVSLADGVVWAIDRGKTFSVIRRAVHLDVTPFFYFDSDALAVRITCRIGFGFTHPQAIVQITASGS